MSTQNWSQTFDITSDAAFRATGSTISAKIQAVNAGILTVTADTGQINWATVTRPGTNNTAAGYEIYKFTDSIGTLYFKIEYGVQTVNQSLAMWITVGTGTNGAGTITGVLGTRAQSGNNGATTSTILTYACYMCCVDGAFWFCLGVGSHTTTPTNVATLAITRTCDSSGAVTGDGIEQVNFQSNISLFRVQATNVATGYTNVSVTGNHCLIPYGIASSDYGTGGNHAYQCWRHEMPMPQTLTTALIASYITVEAGAATTYSMALVGSTNHTFMFLGTAVDGAANAAAGFSLLLVYE